MDNGGGTREDGEGGGRPGGAWGRIRLAGRGMRGIWPLILILLLSSALFYSTLGRYYGYYYDNKFFNLLALELWESPRLYLYLGSHYHVPSSLFSYILYPLYLVFGPGDFPTELLAAVFHLLTVVLCYMLGSLHSRKTGLVFSALTAFAPIHLIQVYTIPDLSFAVFLSALSLYLFMRGVEKASSVHLLAAAFVYSLACFQAIYYLLLLPFYLFYSLYCAFAGPPRSSAVPSSSDLSSPASSALARKAVIAAVLAVFALPAYSYLALLLNASFGPGGVLFTAFFIMLSTGAAVYLKRPSFKQASVFLVFPVVFTALIAYYDMIVQVDCLFLGKSLGYYLDAAPAGGYGGRPLARLMGREVQIYGYPVVMSVLTSMFEFAGKDFAKTSFLSFEGVSRLYYDYFVISYTFFTRVLFFAGIGALAVKAALRAWRERRFPAIYVYPFVWLVSAAAPYVNLGPPYFNIRRIYILPLPLLFAAFGVSGISAAAEWLCKRFMRVRPAAAAGTAVLALLTVAATADQLHFSVEKIYRKYIADKRENMYFKLYYGHFYGRSYEEAGDFILRDAPPKTAGEGRAGVGTKNSAVVYRAALVYTIPEDSKVGRSLPLFNTINWYTRNQIEVIYHFKVRSMELYGTTGRLTEFLDGLFKANAALETVYFADFVDDVNNFSFFSRAHPHLKPYAVIDDDGSTVNDCMLYKFERGSWRNTIPSQ